MKEMYELPGIQVDRMQQTHELADSMVDRGGGEREGEEGVASVDTGVVATAVASADLGMNTGAFTA